MATVPLGKGGGKEEKIGICSTHNFGGIGILKAAKNYPL